MSKENDLLGGPLFVVKNGHRYPVGPCTGDVEIAFTSWLEMHARDKIARRKKELGAEYTLHLRIWQERVDAEEYEWTGYTSLMARQSEAGKKHLLWLLMSSVGAPVTPAAIDSMFLDPEVMEQLFNEDVGEGKPPMGVYWRAVNQGRPTTPAPAPDNPTAS